MKRLDRYTIEALVLIGLGVLFLLQNLGQLGGIAGLIWAAAFTLGGLAFLALFARRPASWWAVIPGCALLGVALLVGLGELLPGAMGAWAGALFLGVLSLSFWVVYLTGHERWWAIIPAGVLLTLAAVAGLTENLAGVELGWVFFLGLALTFGLLAILPTPQANMRWALIPAAAMLAMAVIVLAAAEPLFNLLWPVLLILAGLFVAFRGLRAQHQV